MLSDTGITDRGMAHLCSLKELRWLTVERTHVTDAGVKRLQLAVPSCGAVVHSAPRLERPEAATELLAAQNGTKTPPANSGSTPIIDRSREAIVSRLALEER
jgi:hypothetical protein